MRPPSPDGAPERAAPSVADPETPPRHRGRWTAIAALTVVVVVAPLAVQAFGRAMHRSLASDVTYHRPIRVLEIDAPSAVVRVRPGDAGQVRLHRRLAWSLSKPRVESFWDGDTLRIDATCTGDGPFGSMDCEAELDLRVPAQAAAHVSVGSGVIEVRDLTGPVRAGASSGQVKLVGVRGDVQAAVTSGGILGSVLTSSQVVTSVTSGQVQLSFAGVPRRVVASSTSGPIDVGLSPSGQYHVTGQSGSGDRHIDDTLVNGRSPNEVRVTSGSGSVRVGCQMGDPRPPH